jgi:diguanylate cyclase (GGDEF)-like protein
VRETPQAVRHLRHAALAGCWLVVVVGLVVLVGGWVFGRVELRNLVPGTVGMKALTAIGLLGASLSLLGALSEPRSPRLRVLQRGLALFTLTLGALVLSEYVFGWRLGIDELPFVDRTGRTAGIAHPGRFAPTTAINFVLIGAALLAIDREPRHGWRRSEVFVLPAALVALMSVIGYTYGIPAFYGPASAAKMALNTAACFLALAIAIVLARPHGHVLRLATTDDPGGVTMRRLGPLAILLPLLLGWLRLTAGDHGVFTDRVGTWWLTAATVGCFLALIWRLASRLSAADRDQRALRLELERLANHDGLTDLYNRHRFDEELTRTIGAVHRYGRPASVLILDLDRMKAVNDELGHRVGDAMLRAVADVLRTELRNTDIAARMGGDEFGVLLAETEPDQAAVLAERVLGEIRASRVPAGDGRPDAWTTASIGIARLDGEAPVERALAHADDAMYAAKRAGGDRCAVSGAGVEVAAG